jgi:hypothetical protein
VAAKIAATLVMENANTLENPSTVEGCKSFLGVENYEFSSDYPDVVAKSAFLYADALLAEWERTGQ